MTESPATVIQAYVDAIAAAAASGDPVALTIWLSRLEGGLATAEAAGAVSSATAERYRTAARRLVQPQPAQGDEIAGLRPNSAATDPIAPREQPAQSPDAGWDIGRMRAVGTVLRKIDQLFVVAVLHGESAAAIVWALAEPQAGFDGRLDIELTDERGTATAMFQARGLPQPPEAVTACIGWSEYRPGLHPKATRASLRGRSWAFAVDLLPVSF